MTDNESPSLPAVTPEQRRAAAGQFERANQVIASGNHDYGIDLLLTCCKLDPANLTYRRTLRQTEKIKYKHNLHGSRMSLLTSSASKAKLKAAKRARDLLKVLEYGEEVLARNPWDTGAQLDMAEAAEMLGLLDVAVWTLDQARQKDPKDAAVNRAMALLLEKRGNFVQAIALWNLVRSVAPADAEAAQKMKDLAVHETIARGNYDQSAIGEKTAAGSETKTPGPGAAMPGGEAEPEAATPSRPTNDRSAQEAALMLTRIAADPTNPLPYLQLAGLYRRNDQFEQAREVLTEGLGATGKHFDLATELAEVEIEPFRRNLVIAEGKLKTKPQHEGLRKIRIRLLKEINTRELDLFRQKADRYPADKSFRFELGVRLLRAQQVDEAIRELQAIRSDPRYQWRALLYLGFCFKSRKNWRLAQRNFEEALKNLPSGEEEWRKEVLFELAQGSAGAGELDHALDWGHELANLDFGYRDIGRLIDEWESARGGAEGEGAG